MRARGERAFSLLETLIALFIIVMALLIMTQLMHTALQRGTVVEKRLLGALCAQQKLEEIRAWALDATNFHGSWSTYDNVVSQNPQFPGLQTRTTLSDQPLSTPSRLLEEPYLATERRILPGACRGVTVECWWGSGPQQRLELNSLVGAPPDSFRTVNPIEITPSTLSMAKDSTATFSAKAFDAAGREIEGMTFSWFIVPKSGTGLMVGQTRDGRAAEIGHWLYALDGVSHTYAPGACEFAVRAKYCGIEVVESAQVDLQ
jgi:type II secretory pathway pseudopilin PulG